MDSALVYCNLFSFVKAQISSAQKESNTYQAMQEMFKAHIAILRSATNVCMCASYIHAYCLCVVNICQLHKSQPKALKKSNCSFSTWLAYCRSMVVELWYTLYPIGVKIQS